MEWEVQLHPDIAERLSSLPVEWRPQFEAALAKLASDPKGLGHMPVMPYAWKGPLWDFRVRDGSGHVINVTVFFLFDDDPNVHKIHIHDLTLISVFHGDRSKPTLPAETSTGPVTEIPAAPGGE